MNHGTSRYAESFSFPTPEKILSAALEVALCPVIPSSAVRMPCVARSSLVARLVLLLIILLAIGIFVQSKRNDCYWHGFDRSLEWGMCLVSRL
jgi:hypothetical protein